MPIELGGVTYLLATEVADLVGVSRHTFWKWRQAGKVPPGRKYRGRLVIFTSAELEQVRQYAHRVEPIGRSDIEQLRLFPNGNGPRTGGTQ